MYEARKFKMAPQVGLEPTAYRLTAECSTIELLRNKMLCDVLSSHIVTNALLSALKDFTSEFGMRSGVSLSLSSQSYYII